jgi:hypothetical protein
VKHALCTLSNPAHKEQCKHGADKLSSDGAVLPRCPAWAEMKASTSSDIWGSVCYICNSGGVKEGADIDDRRMLHCCNDCQTVAHRRCIELTLNDLDLSGGAGAGETGYVCLACARDVAACRHHNSCPDANEGEWIGWDIHRIICQLNPHMPIDPSKKEEMAPAAAAAAAAVAYVAAAAAAAASAAAAVSAAVAKAGADADAGAEKAAEEAEKEAAGKVGR